MLFAVDQALETWRAIEPWLLVASPIVNVIGFVVIVRDMLNDHHLGDE